MPSRCVTQLLSGGPELPSTLAEQPRDASSRKAAPGRRRLALGVASVAVAAGTLAAALALALSPSTPPPTVAAVSRLGLAPALEQVPRSRPGHPALVTASFEGVDFPNWSRRFGWHTSGARSDRLNDRTTFTVFYAHMGHRIGYTVVAGPPLEIPARGRHLTRDGMAVTIVGDGMHASTVFVRDGRPASSPATSRISRRWSSSQPGGAKARSDPRPIGDPERLPP